jgi:predicted RNA-binding Zn-ribbon protein involved in translation (DUF1610 family)
VPPRPAVPTVSTQRVLCPYCGEVSADPRRCEVCRGFFDPLSRQATQNAMGPWFIRDGESPFRPGCSIETLRDLIRRGKVTRDTIIRGPGTKQFWNFAGRTPSIANLLGLCHNCRATAKPDDYSCKSCGAVFSPDPDRQHLGLAPVHILPGEASPEMVAAASLDTPAPVPVPASPSPADHAGPVAAVGRPATIEPAASQPEPEPGPRRSLGPWLVGATVVILAAMGTVVGLIATGTISLPWLTGEQPQPRPPVSPTAAPATTPSIAPPTPRPEAPAATVPSPTGEPGPSSAPPTPAPSGAVQPIDVKALLEPMLSANPFDEAAMLARIEELRASNPELGKDLDSWAAAAKSRAELLRLRRIP